MMWIIAVVSAATAFAIGGIWYLRSLNRPTQHDPPCPGSDFIIGSFRYFGQNPIYRSLAEKYPDSDVVLLYLGCTRVYVLNSYSAFKEAMVDNAEALSGRISQKSSVKIFGDRGGLASSDGELWRSYRRFTLQTLRDFGLGRKGAEHCITAEVEDLCNEITASNGKPINIGFLLGRNVSNVICQLVFGSRLASESEEFAELFGTFNRIVGNPAFQENNFRSLALLPLTSRFDFLMDLALKLPKAAAIKKISIFLFAFCDRQVDKHRAEMQDGAEARDYIEAHLKHQAKESEFFNNRRLNFAILDLFIAGTETTANTLRWALMLMVAHPDVATKVHKEVIDCVGSARLPAIGDKSSLHYTQATIEEVHRYTCLVPMGFNHRLTEDVKVAGYTLPRDSYVLYNMHKIHRDPVEFPQPDEFRPERHLDSNGLFRSSQKVIAFGAGKRACLGESLARMELLLFFAGLMQRFRFELDLESCGGVSASEMLNARETHLSTLVRTLPEFKLLAREWNEE